MVKKGLVSFGILIVLGILLINLVSAYTIVSTNYYRSNGSPSDTQLAITDIPQGGTVEIPAGNYTWASGLSISKFVKIIGAGGGKIEGNSKTSNTISSSGSKTFSVQSGLDWNVGETIRAVSIRTGDSMTGVVSSYSGSTLVISVTSSSGSGTHGLWVFENDGRTIITYDGGSSMFAVSKSSAGSISVGDLDIIRGSSSQILFSVTGSGEPPVFHDMKIKNGAGSISIFYFYSNGGLVYKVDAYSVYGWGTLQVITGSFADIQFGGTTDTWTTQDYLGMRDSTGKSNTYFEDNDIVGFATEAFDCSDNCRAVVRKSRFVHSGITSHGPDTGTSGLRHFEIYNNSFVFVPSASTCPQTLNMDYHIFIRGGMNLIANNYIEAMSGSCYSKAAIKYTVMAPWRTGGNYGCWTSYPVPHQIGRNWVSGQGEINDNSSIWGNTGTASQSPGLDQYPNTCGASGDSQSISDYLQEGRDYVVGIARPGWVAYTYPHPLRVDSTINAASCSAYDVEVAISSAQNGDTILVPSGNCDWNDGSSSSSVSVGTGSKTFITEKGLNIFAGDSIFIYLSSNKSVNLTGTVVSYNNNYAPNNGELVININKIGGSGIYSSWVFQRDASVIVNKRVMIVGENSNSVKYGRSTQSVVIKNNAGSPLFTLITGNDYHTGIQGIRFNEGSRTSNHIFASGSGSKVALLNDIYMEHVEKFGNAKEVASIRWEALGGVWWNSYFYGPDSVEDFGGERIWVASPNRPWTSASTMGTLDSNGAVNLYIEDSTFIRNANGIDFDPNARAVIRNSIFDCSAFTHHGLTSGAGARHTEWYNNTFSDTISGCNLDRRYLWVRGGTTLMTDNTINGAAYPGQYGEVSQIKIGEHDDIYGSYPPTQTSTYDARYMPGWGHDGNNFVSDPIYIWNNTGSRANTYSHISSYWSNMVQLGRDLFIGVAKPNWQPYIYPHPARTGGSGVVNPPNLVYYNLTITKTGTGSGTVSGNGINCGSSCSVLVASGTQVSLSAAPNSGSNFISWNNSCTTSNPCVFTINSNTSIRANFTLTPPSAPSITTQPISPQTGYIGQTASFSVTASGTTPLSYQWQKDGVNIAGATSATYTKTGLVLADAGNYRVIVTNAYGSVTSNVAVLTVTSAPALPTDLLRLYYNFDNNVIDQSSNNNHGTLSSASYISGKINQAASFSGTSSSYVSAADSASINLIDSFSISFWIKRARNGVWETVYDSGTNTGRWMIQFEPTNKLVYFINDASDRNYYSSASISDTNWHHVVINKNANTINFYIDNIAAGTSSISGTPTPTTPSGIKKVGADNSASPYSGQMDELRIYARTLTTTEINTLYNYNGVSEPVFVYHPSDSNNNKVIEYSELLTYMNSYLSGNIDMKRALYALTIRQSGGNYNNTANTDCTNSPWNCWSSV